VRETEIKAPHLILDVSVMGRRVPTNEKPLMPPVLSFSLLAVGIAATIAMIAALCGVRSRKRSSPSQSPSPYKETEKSGVFDSTATTTTTTMTSPTPPKPAEPVEAMDSTDDKETQDKDLPRPPAMKQMGEADSSNHLTKSASDRRMTMSLSMKLPRSMSMARREENHRRKKGKLNPEDSIWMKTIILGEKCKVPEEDDAVVYDGKGNRISTYHPRTASMLSLSRQCSFNEQDTAATQQRR
jgi:hypothetical protein